MCRIVKHIGEDERQENHGGRARKEVLSVGCLNGFGEGIEAVGAVKAFLILTAAVFGLAVAPGGIGAHKLVADAGPGGGFKKSG